MSDPDELADLTAGMGWDDLVASGVVAAVTPEALALSRSAVHEAIEIAHATDGSASDPARRWTGRRVALPVLAGAAAVAVTFALVLSQASSTPGEVVPPVAAASSQASGPVGPFSVASCVEEHGVRSLAGRDFAFDGTVIAMGSPSPGEEDIGYSAVTFHVNEWFRGGSSATVTIAMSAPGDGGNRPASPDPTSEWAPDYVAGTRLLVSGEPRRGGQPMDDAVAWGCGFTRFYDARTASDWRQVFTG